MKNMSLNVLKTVANQKMSPLQRIIKALSDVFVDIMPSILAAALLTGLSGVLGNLEFVKAKLDIFFEKKVRRLSACLSPPCLPLWWAHCFCLL